MAAKYQLTTLGCKVNQYESQQIRELLDSLGLHPAQEGETPDIAVVNTCAVTAEASRKNRQAIRRAARAAHTPVIVIGCGASADADQLSRLDGATTLLGHGLDACSALQSLLNQPGVLSALLPQNAACAGTAASTQRPGVSRNDVSIRPSSTPGKLLASTPWATNASIDTMLRDPPIVNSDEPLTGRISRFAGHQRGLLKVQDGCDAPCTYCIVPRVRPRLRSKPIDVAVAEARDLVLAGHKEIVVTGVVLGAYGRETDVRHPRLDHCGSPLADLVRALAKVEGLQRLRLSSLDPKQVDEPLLQVLATHENCVPHLHLPLQSGSDTVLRRMNRQYRREEFVDVLERIKAALDRPAITTDIIVGFPGETEADFDATLEIARNAEFCKIHAFPFSPRRRTVAARWKAECPPPTVVRERLRRLAGVERECSLTFRRRFLGCLERVIVERPRVFDGGPPAAYIFHHGRADRYFEIQFEACGQGPESHRGDRVSVGDIVPVRITEVTPTGTHGVVVGRDAG